MIALSLFLVGMTLYTLLIIWEWLCREWRACKAAFSKPLATYQREPRTYMLTATELRDYHRTADGDYHRTNR